MRKLASVCHLLFLFVLAIRSVAPAAETGEFDPVYRLPLRIHLGASARPLDDWRPILGEINEIWLSQAGICFSMQTVLHDHLLEQGFDLWFDAIVQGWNGYYNDPHDIRVRDTPDLAPAAKPARHPAARTAAHELGHALGLGHRQDSPDNLMASKTYGWQLNEEETVAARQRAARLAVKGVAFGGGKCGGRERAGAGVGEGERRGEN